VTLGAGEGTRPYHEGKPAAGRAAAVLDHAQMLIQTRAASFNTRHVDPSSSSSRLRR